MGVLYGLDFNMVRNVCISKGFYKSGSCYDYECLANYVDSIEWFETTIDNIEYIATDIVEHTNDCEYFNELELFYDSEKIKQVMLILIQKAYMTIAND